MRPTHPHTPLRSRYTHREGSESSVHQLIHPVPLNTCVHVSVFVGVDAPTPIRKGGERESTRTSILNHPVAGALSLSVSIYSERETHTHANRAVQEVYAEEANAKRKQKRKRREEGGGRALCQYARDSFAFSSRSLSIASCADLLCCPIASTWACMSTTFASHVASCFLCMSRASLSRAT